MIFLSLRNNRKLTHSWWENIRKVLFGAIIAGCTLLMIMSLDIHNDQFGDNSLKAYDAHFLTALVVPIASMILTMFVIIAMNKHDYVKLRYKFLFEILYMGTCIAITSIFYLRMISIEILMTSFLVSSVVVMFLSFIYGVSNINYKATTIYGPLVVKPISYDGIKQYLMVSAYIGISLILQACNILYFKFVDPELKNYLLYQFLIMVGSVTFFLLALGTFTASRSLGTSQEVLYYRYAQLVILTSIFLAINLGLYRLFVPVQSTRELVDNICIGLNLLPMFILFINLWMNKRKLDRDKNYQGFTELRLMIKILAAVTAVLINMIASVEAKYFMTGEAQTNIDVTLIGLAVIMFMIAVPFFLFWKKITKRSSRILTTLGFIIFSFMLYKFYFFIDFRNASSTMFDVPIDSIYTMMTILGVTATQIVTIVFQARNSGAAYRRYGHINTKGVNNG